MRPNSKYPVWTDGKIVVAKTSEEMLFFPLVLDTEFKVGDGESGHLTSAFCLILI